MIGYRLDASGHDFATAEMRRQPAVRDPAMDPATFDHSGHGPVSGRQKWDAVYQSECPADIIRIRRQGIASVGLGIGGRAELSPNQMGRCPQLFCEE